MNVPEIVASLRRQAASLRATADELSAEALRLERGQYGDNPLRGADVAEEAHTQLLFVGAMHYRDLAERVEQRTGRKIAGKDPAMVLLANITRDDRFHRIGRGVYATNGAK